jgi:hypothetical protein
MRTESCEGDGRLSYRMDGAFTAIELHIHAHTRHPLKSQHRNSDCEQRSSEESRCFGMQAGKAIKA